MTLLLLLACSDYNVVAKPVDVDPGDVTDCDFTRVDSTAFYAYDCNPVFTTTGETWLDGVGGTSFGVTEVVGHPFYQLWYVGVTGSGTSSEADDGYGLGYAVSADGTTWTPWDGNPGLTSDDNQGFDKTTLQGNPVVWDPDRSKYIMMYGGLDLSSPSGNEGGLGVATSDDGRTWSRNQNNPIIPLNPTNVNGATNWCWFLGMSLGEVAGYEGYIAGADKAGACSAWEISGSDPQTWTVQKDVAISGGAKGEWDDMGFISMSQASLGSDTYLFYVGFGDWEDHGYYQSATNAYLGWMKKDGSDWVRQGDPIPVNQTDVGEVSSVAAVTVGSRIHLWVTDDWDGAQAVGYYVYDPEKAAEEDGG